ncbi:MAG: acyloxyacyl hydrolase [Bacteroidota bacterium]
MFNNFRHIFLFLFIILTVNSYCQGNIDGKPFIKPKDDAFFTEKGFNVGVPVYSITLDEGYNYRPLLLMANWGHKFSKKIKNGVWWMIIEPQFNPVFLDNKLKEAEFGVNLAFRYKYKLSDGLYFYAQLGSGPHFITISTSRQAHGYIFSDNLAFGFSKSISKNIMLNVQARIRHISNANIMLPNRGMNNGLIVLGISKLIN